MWCGYPRLRARGRLVRQRRDRGMPPRRIHRRTGLVELSGVPPCAGHVAPAPPPGARLLGAASMSTRTGITTFQCPLALPTVPDGELDDVAEADAARLVAAELHEGDLVGGNE